MKTAAAFTVIALMLLSGRAPAASSGPLTESAVTERSKALVPSPPWSKGDERGMANTLGAGTLMRCGFYLGAVGAKTYELSYVNSNTMPQSPFGKHLEFRASPSTSLPGTRHLFNGEQVVGGGEPGQQGTQFDALGHFAYYDQAWDGKGDAPVNGAHYYGGFTQSEVKPTADSFLLKLGVEKVPPIITSAVLLDAKTYLGKGAALKPGQLVTAANIQDMLQLQGLSWRGILPGDVVYIYTGWGDGWTDPDIAKTYYTMGPGLAADAAKYLAARAVVLIGLDNPFTDAVAEGQLAQKAQPPQGMEQGLPFIIHHTNLAINGIHQIQNVNLTAIARDKVWTSCTMILPLLERGHAGSPVRPVAVGVSH
jgi:kynurenine formamidase